MRLTDPEEIDPPANPMITAPEAGAEQPNPRQNP